MSILVASLLALIPFAVPQLASDGSANFMTSSLIEHPRCGLPVLFVHLHKAGGTTFCTMARANGARTPQGIKGKSVGFFGMNCNPSTIEDARTAVWSSPQDSAKYAETHSLDLFMNEFYMPPSLPTLGAPQSPRVRFVIMLRDPLERIVSHCGPTPNAALGTFISCALQPKMRNYFHGRLCACECGACEASAARGSPRACMAIAAVEARSTMGDEEGHSHSHG